MLILQDIVNAAFSLNTALGSPKQESKIRVWARNKNIGTETVLNPEQETTTSAHTILANEKAQKESGPLAETIENLLKTLIADLQTLPFVREKALDVMVVVSIKPYLPPAMAIGFSLGETQFENVEDPYWRGIRGWNRIEQSLFCLEKELSLIEKRLKAITNINPDNYNTKERWVIENDLSKDRNFTWEAKTGVDALNAHILILEPTWMRLNDPKKHKIRFYRLPTPDEAYSLWHQTKSSWM